MTGDDSRTVADATIIELGDFDLIRWDNEWRLMCGCGDIINFPDVVHGHCVNCHMTCEVTSDD